MTNVIPLASRRAAPTPAQGARLGAPSDPVQLYADAHNALAMALHYLHSDGERLRRLTEQMSPTVAAGGDELEALRRENRELRELLGDIARRLSDG